MRATGHQSSKAIPVLCRPLWSSTGSRLSCGLLTFSHDFFRVLPTYLDENLDWKWSQEELVNFLVNSIESMFHIIAAALCTAIGSARTMSQTKRNSIYECDTGWHEVEKNVVSITALVLFFNHFIVFKPYRGLGVLVQTMYRLFFKDVFDFLIMIAKLSLAFLLALQTLHISNMKFLAWMDQSTDMLPQIQKAENLIYLANDIPPAFASSILATDNAVNGCLTIRRSIYDTAFAIMETRLGTASRMPPSKQEPRSMIAQGFLPTI